MIEWGCLGVFGRCDGVCLRSGQALPSATAIRVLAKQARRIILCSIHGEHHLLLKCCTSELIRGMLDGRKKEKCCGGDYTNRNISRFLECFRDQNS